MVEVWLTILSCLLVALVGILCFCLYQRRVSLKRIRNYVGRLFNGSSVDEEKAILTHNDTLDLSKESLVRCCKRGPTRDDSTELSVTPPTDYQQFNSTPSAVPVRTQVKVVLNSPKSLVRAEIPPHAHMTTVNSSSPSGPQVISPRRQPPQMDSTPINSRCDPPEFSASLDISADLDFPNGVERRLSAISISSGVSDTSDEICSEGEEIPLSHLQRAMSTDSIESTTSLNELITNDDQSCGQLETKLTYDRSEKRLAIGIIQACDLKVLGFNSEVWVVVFLLPHAKPLWRTQLTKGAPNPQFHEKYEQKIREQDVRKFALLCQVYCRFLDKVSLIGQAKVRLKDLELTEAQTTWISILPPKAAECQDSKLGEVLFSLHWLPTAERLTVVIGKTKKIKKTDGSTPHNILLKAYLVQGPKKILKKKTSVKTLSADGAANVNESMTFTLNQSYFHKVHLRLSVVERLDNGDDLTVGHITVGGRCSEHWNQMVRSTPKPVPMWHPIMPKKSDF